LDVEWHKEPLPGRRADPGCWWTRHRVAAVSIGTTVCFCVCCWPLVTLGTDVWPFGGRSGCTIIRFLRLVQYPTVVQGASRRPATLCQ